MSFTRDYYLGRQPILGRGGELVAYECLFRSGSANRAAVTDDVAATAAVIQHAFLDLGVEAALGAKTGFINISQELLMTDLIEVLPRHRVVLELLETVEPGPDLLARCAALRAGGYRLALDDVTDETPSITALLPHADIVKIDILNMPGAKIAELAARFRPRVKTMLAEKVETADEFAQCRALGFDLFQGYFFAKPSIITGRAVQPTELILIRLLAALIAGAEIEALEELLKRLPDLTLRLLSLANAAATFRTHKIRTLGNAIVMLGREQLRRLVKIVLFARARHEQPGADPLLQTAITRGRLMELVARAHCRSEVARHAFMVGMLSLADALFDQPLADILAAIEPDEMWVAALLRREGELGQLLTMAEATERGDDDALNDALTRLGVQDLAGFAPLQVEALQWANAF